MGSEWLQWSGSSQLKSPPPRKKFLFPLSLCILYSKENQWLEIKKKMNCEIMAWKRHLMNLSPILTIFLASVCDPPTKKIICLFSCYKLHCYSLFLPAVWCWEGRVQWVYQNFSLKTAAPGNKVDESVESEPSCKHVGWKTKKKMLSRVEEKCRVSWLFILWVCHMWYAQYALWFDPMLT